MTAVYPGGRHRPLESYPQFRPAWTDAVRRQQDTDDVLEDVSAERGRQFAKHGDQAHLPNGTGSWYDGVLARQARAATDAAAAAGTVTFRHILLEEVHEALAEGDDEALRAELIQVAAVAVQWAEAIDRRTPRREPITEPPYIRLSPGLRALIARAEDDLTRQVLDPGAFTDASGVGGLAASIRDGAFRREYLGEFTETDPRSPDCQAGKCRACVGEAWDEAADAPVPCPCTCHDRAAAAAGQE